VPWSLTDTTHWRIPDMTALATIVLAGWWMAPPSLFLGQLLVLWGAVAGAAFSSFALVGNR